jgi:pilus assembly protein Flp/PilA
MSKYLRLIRLPSAKRHRAVVNLAARALKDDRGGEVLEYALVAGLVVVASIGTIACVGKKITDKWSTMCVKL